MVKKRYIFAFLLINIFFLCVGILNNSKNQNSFAFFSSFNLSDYDIHSNWWSKSGNPICLASGNQTNIQITKSGLGNFIVWQDNRSGNWDIYAQRIDNDGFIQRIDYFGFQWKPDGLVICNEPGDQVNPHLVPDGYSGVIIVWQDNRSGNWDIYAQKISEKGNRIWSQNGIIICNADEYQRNPKIVSDSQKGAIICWIDNRTGNDEDIYAQKINSRGQTQWFNNGTIICNETGDQNNQEMCSDGNKGAILVWEDSRGSSLDIYAQRINSSGYTEWGNNGTTVCNQSQDQQALKVISDGNKGCIIVWEDFRNINSDIYAQKIDQTGSMLWTNNGTVVCNNTEQQTDPKICGDSSKGAIITWIDNRTIGNNYDIFGQHIDSAGNVSWTFEGLAICNTSSIQTNHQIIKRSNGAIIIWADNQTSSFGIYCQFLSLTSGLRFGIKGKRISDVNNGQNYPKVSPDSHNGAIIAWEDSRSSIDIYTQRIFKDGRVAPLNIFIPHRIDLTPDPFIIIFILLVFGIPLCTAFTYCLLQMRPKEQKKKKKVRRKRRHRRKKV